MGEIIQGEMTIDCLLSGRQYVRDLNKCIIYFNPGNHPEKWIEIISILHTRKLEPKDINSPRIQTNHQVIQTNHRVFSQECI